MSRTHTAHVSLTFAFEDVLRGRLTASPPLSLKGQLYAPQHSLESEYPPPIPQPLQPVNNLLTLPDQVPPGG